jgi:hypothetical protein
MLELKNRPSRLIKINKLIWSKEYKKFERNNKYKNKIKINKITESDENLNIISSSINDEEKQEKNIIIPKKRKY